MLIDKMRLLETKAALVGWALTSKRPTILLLVLTNSLFWTLLLLASGDSQRGVMRQLETVMPVEWWAVIWSFAFSYQLVSNILGSGRCIQWSAAIVAILNTYCTALISIALWPDIPAPLAGNICVMMASILLFVSGDRRCNRKQKGEVNARRQDD